MSLLDKIRGVNARVGPTKFYGAEPAEDGTIVRLADGRRFLDVNIIIDEDSVEQIRQGYKCIRCFEPQSEPFPVLCESRAPAELGGERWCNFPIRAQQREEFEIMFKGEVEVGSRISVVDELGRLREIDEYEAKHGVVLPDHVKFPNEVHPS